MWDTEDSSRTSVRLEKLNCYRWFFWNALPHLPSIRLEAEMKAHSHCEEIPLASRGLSPAPWCISGLGVLAGHAAAWDDQSPCWSAGLSFSYSASDLASWVAVDDDPTAWKTWMEFQAPGLGVAQPWLLWAFAEWTKDRRTPYARLSLVFCLPSKPKTDINTSFKRGGNGSERMVAENSRNFLSLFASPGEHVELGSVLSPTCKRPSLAGKIFVFVFQLCQL